MIDDGDHFDQNSKDGVYGIEIKPIKGQKEIDFYIEAENAVITSQYPSNYRNAPLSSSLLDLNK